MAKKLGTINRTKKAQDLIGAGHAVQSMSNNNSKSTRAGQGISYSHIIAKLDKSLKLSNHSNLQQPDIRQALQDIINKTKTLSEQQLKPQTQERILYWYQRVFNQSPLQQDDQGEQIISIDDVTNFDIDMNEFEGMFDNLLHNQQNTTELDQQSIQEQIDQLAEQEDDEFEDDQSEKEGELSTKPSPEDSYFLRPEFAKLQDELNSYLQQQKYLQHEFQQLNDGVQKDPSTPRLLLSKAQTLNKNFQSFSKKFSKFLNKNPSLAQDYPKQQRNAQFNLVKANQNDIVIQDCAKQLKNSLAKDNKAQLNNELEVIPEQQPGKSPSTPRPK